MRTFFIYIFISSIFFSSVISCGQKQVSEDEIIAKRMEERYGAELSMIKDVQDMECDDKLSEEVEKRLEKGSK